MAILSQNLLFIALAASLAAPTACFALFGRRPGSLLSAALLLLLRAVRLAGSLYSAPSIPLMPQGTPEKRSRLPLLLKIAVRFSNLILLMRHMFTNPEGCAD